MNKSTRPELFERKLLKQKVEPRMGESRFFYLMKKGLDPAYYLELVPEDYPTWRRVSWLVNIDQLIVGPINRLHNTVTYYEKSGHVVVLSKGLQDLDRRIVGRGSTAFTDGFWIALLRRQLRTGSLDVRAWCYETLLDLERHELWGHVYENWTKKLMGLRTPF